MVINPIEGVQIYPYTKKSLSLVKWPSPEYKEVIDPVTYEEWDGICKLGIAESFKYQHLAGGGVVALV